MVKDVTPPLQSRRWEMNQFDWAKLVADAIVFFTPAAIVFLAVLQSGGTIKEALAAIYTWALGMGINFLKKLHAGQPK